MIHIASRLSSGQTGSGHLVRSLPCKGAVTSDQFGLVSPGQFSNDQPFTQVRHRLQC